MSINNLNTYLNIKDSHLRVVSGNVYAQAMNIGGINVETAHGLQSVSNTGNVTSNTLQFSNAITGFVTTANAQIGRDLVVSGNTTVSTDLTVSANATVADTLTISEHLIASKEATITGNLHVTTIRSDSNVVTEYTGPHDRPLRKYPEVALTAASQGGYIVTQSNQDTVNSYFAYKAFNEIKGAPAAGTDIWYSGGLSHYNTSDGSAVLSGSDIAPRLDTNTDYGEWIGLELPKPIKLDSFKLWRQFNFQNHHPVSATLYAKKTSSDSWTEIYRYDDIDVRQGDTPGQFNVNSQIFYKFFAFVGRKRSQGVASVDGISLAELEYYGHEEGSGSLDTTLKTVYNVPATTGTQLEVYYDGQDYTDMPTVGSASVIDKAGGDQTGTPSSGVSFDSTYKAFVFDGTTNGKIEGTHGLGTGTGIQYSMSLWFKADVLSGNHRLATFGTQGTQYQSSSLLIYQNDIHLDHWTSEMKTTSDILVSNVWYHLVATHTGPGTNDVSQNALYLNGVKLENVTTGGSAGNGTFNLQGTGLTIGADSAGTNPFNGSIANFRLYSKALNAGEVQELYDYQKDYFLGSKSQVTLYKGHLGVGVTEPSGQLELAGDERIQEYPPGPMSGYETYMEGHGVFCAYAGDSDAYAKSPHYFQAWEVFDDTTSIYHGGQRYTGGTDRAYVGSIQLHGQGIKGDYIVLEMPYQIKVQSVSLGTGGARQPKDFTIVGSNDGSTWTTIKSFSGQVYSSETNFLLNSTEYFSKLAIIVTKLQGDAYWNQNHIKYFGTPGPTTLDQGSLTLGRSLNVPRISRYDAGTETPRPDKLIFHMDTTVNKWPVDISGRCCPLTVQNGTAYAGGEKAFKFDGVNDSIQGKTMIRGVEVNTSYTISLWVKTLADNTDNDVFFFLGSGSTGNSIGFRHSGSKDAYTLYHFSNDDLYITGTGKSTYNEWRNLVATYDGTSQRIYIDGILAGERAVTGTGGGSSLHIGDLEQLSIGRRWSGGVANEYLTGYISNVKLWSVCLNKGEILQNYKLGRTGRSMVITDTAVGIGRHPEAQLDVGGTAIVRGSLSIGDRSGMNPAHLSAGEVSDTNRGDVSMSAPLCVFSESMNGSDGFDIYRSLAKFCFGGPVQNSQGNYGYGLAIGVSANQGHSAIQTINQGTNDNAGAFQYDLRLQPSGGNVGIGHINDPVAMLDVRGSVNNYMTAQYYNSGGGNSSTTATRPLSGYFGSHLACAELQVFSDRRIKDNIRDINDDSALQLFRRLKPKTYTYKDTVERGTDHTYGFIAQEIREVLPLATSELSRDIPNIYEKAKLSKTGVLSFTNFDTSRLEANAMNIIMYTVDSDKRQEFEIDEVLSPKLIRLKGDLPPDEEVFVYGQYVDDFVSLNKNSIWTIATAALQEVDRQLQFERTRNDALEARVSALEQAKYM